MNANITVQGQVFLPRPMGDENQHVYDDIAGQPKLVVHESTAGAAFGTWSGIKGDMRRENGAWVLYEGPIRSRHELGKIYTKALQEAAIIMLEKELQHGKE